MKTQTIAIATRIAVLFTGCAGTSPTRLVGNTIGVAGGALLGSTLGKRNPLATAAGAGAGLLLSESLPAGSTAAANKSYAAGYEKGRSDSAKQCNTTGSSTGSASQPTAPSIKMIDATSVRERRVYHRTSIYLRVGR